MYARDLFDLREYKRCAYLLKPHKSIGNQSVIFLYYYSLFMYGDIRKVEEQYENCKIININTINNYTKRKTQLVKTQK